MALTLPPQTCNQYLAIFALPKLSLDISFEPNAVSSSEMTQVVKLAVCNHEGPGSILGQSIVDTSRISVTGAAFLIVLLLFTCQCFYTKVLRSSVRLSM